VRAHPHSQVMRLIPAMGEDISAMPHLLDTPRVSAYGSSLDSPLSTSMSGFYRDEPESKQRGLPAELRDIAPPPDAALVLQHVLDHRARVSHSLIPHHVFPTLC